MVSVGVLSCGLPSSPGNDSVVFCAYIGCFEPNETARIMHSLTLVN